MSPLEDCRPDSVFSLWSAMMTLYEFAPTRSIRARWVLQELGEELTALQLRRMASTNGAWAEWERASAMAAMGRSVTVSRSRAAAQWTSSRMRWKLAPSALSRRDSARTLRPRCAAALSLVSSPRRSIGRMARRTRWVQTRSLGGSAAGGLRLETLQAPRLRSMTSIKDVADHCGSKPEFGTGLYSDLSDLLHFCFGEKARANGETLAICGFQGKAVAAAGRHVDGDQIAGPIIELRSTRVERTAFDLT